MRTTIFRIALVMTVIVSMTLSSCKKDNFDEPPITLPDPPEKDSVNTTIADLKAMYATFGVPQLITDNIWIQGVVIGDDRAGNIYKQIIIDDGTAGIAIAVDISNFYTEYPVGRKVYVKCRGLYLGDYGKSIQLGGSISADKPSEVARIASALVPRFVFKGPAFNTVTPIPVTISELNDSYQNRLIKLTGFEFVVGDTSKTYADVVAEQSANLTIKNCDNESIIVRSSAFATFAGNNVPNGNGDVVAVFTTFNSTKQLMIRDESDIQFTNSRCVPIVTTDLFYEDFDGVGSGTISITGWTNFSTAGTKNWYATGSTNKNARFSAFDSNPTFQQTSNIGWLITPAINLDNSSNENLTFRRSIGFVSGTIKMEVLYSTDFTGSGDPSSATWTLLVDDAPSAPTSFATSSPINLNAISGSSVYFAFRYTGGYGLSPAATTQYNLDEVKVTGVVTP